jgi:putative CRISPR-associated protein (TIGR02619 family)
MPKFIVSTVGTSLLTNQIEDIDPAEWMTQLQETTNYTLDEINTGYPQISAIISELQKRVESQLKGSLADIRGASAELNGLYGLYKLHGEQLGQDKQDIHWLITTDTAQGHTSAHIVEKFLTQKEIQVQIPELKGLSMISTEAFASGIDNLLDWAEQTIPGYRERGYSIHFNLVGGFKALQGFANTIGMFYADEIIYIFEGSSEIVKIPRLPINIDITKIKPIQFALMASDVGLEVDLSELEGVPETLLFSDGNEATLSNWGRLIWNRSKKDIFTKDLLEFPNLVYERSFLEDYKRKIVDDQKKIELHEVLAKVSASIIKFNGNTTRFDRSLNFSRYEGERICGGGFTKNQIDHFYIGNTGWRVSCLVKKDAQLYLRHFGEHDYVNDNP